MSFKHGLKALFGLAAKKEAANDNFELPLETLSRALFPPHDETKEMLHGREVKDAFRPMEKLDSIDTANWIRRQNDRFQDYITGSEDTRKSVLDFMKKTRPEETSEKMPGRYGDKYFVWRQEFEATRWSYHVKDSADTDPRLLIDVLKIDPSGKTAIASVSPSPDGKTIAYSLSVSGSDETTLKFMDVETGRDTGLVMEKFRSGVAWDADSKGFHYTPYMENISKSLEVKHHRIGTPLSENKTIFSPDTPETGVGYFWLSKDSSDTPGTYEWISVAKSAEPDKHTLLMRKAGSEDAFKNIFSPETGHLHPFEEIGEKIYATTNYGASRGKIVAFDPNDPSPDKWQTIVPEPLEDHMGAAFVWKKRLFVSYSHDTATVLKVYDLEGKFLHDVPLPVLSTFMMSKINSDDTSCLISIKSFTENGAIYKYDLETNTLSLFKESPIPVNLNDCIVERIYATSKDGTQVPMTVIRHPDTQLDGSAATLLYGYGGFNISLPPEFRGSVAQWVKSGGIYVQANLRGGGEYGQEWYDKGRQKNKQNVFDDFIACAERLIEKAYTASDRLAIRGGSNGGLLTLATMIQRPDLFGAVISEVPVTDMNRYHIGSHYGFSWKSDYGDPGIKEDFNTAARYSPLHNVGENFKHPPCLIRTDANDDRVLPWHSYKMAATLQCRESRESLTLLKTNTNGGHSAGQTWKQSNDDWADIYAFLEKTLGPISQKAYKAKLEAENKVKKSKNIISRIAKKFRHS